MPKAASKNGRSARIASTTKYDAHHTVLSKTYGAQADLRRELADSKARVAERAEILQQFSTCADPQRAWLLLEDYFEKLSLARKDFTSQEWWPRLMAAQGGARLEEVAILFLRANRPVPTELLPYASAERFAKIEQAEQEHQILQKLEHWLFPPAPPHLDSPRAALRVVCEPRPVAGQPELHALKVSFSLFRPRSGEKVRPLAEIIELTSRAAHEQELFSPEDWEFIQWLAETCPPRDDRTDGLALGGQWPSGDEPRAPPFLRADHRPDAAPGKRPGRIVLYAPGDPAGWRARAAQGREILRGPAAAGAGGPDLFPASQRAAAGAPGPLGANAGDPGHSAQPSSAHPPAEVTVEERHRVGAALHYPPGGAAIHLRAGGRHGAAALAGAQ